MGEPLPKQVLDTAVDPAAIVQQAFDVERRGFDQRQVQHYLRAVAESLRDSQRREAEMRTRLGRAVRRAEAAEQALRDAPSHDAAELNRECGEQVTTVLEAARVVGEQRVAAAETSARQLLKNAKDEATRLRDEADAVLQERRTEAEVAAADIVAAGRSEAEQITQQARAEADDLLARAAARIEQARDEGDALIHEAEEARAQILEDMERRRRQARAQVERLRVGRDRLLRSYEVVRRTLEETTIELKSSLNEAKVRGDGAARAVIAEPAAGRDQLEAELRDAKMIGRIAIPSTKADESDSADSKPNRRRSSGPVLRSPALPRPLDPPPLSEPDGADPSARQRPSPPEPTKRTGAPPQPKAPAVAPALTASPADRTDKSEADPIAAMIAAAEARTAGTAAPVPADLASGDSGERDDDRSEASLSRDEVASDEEFEAGLAGLADSDLAVVEPSDEIEEVVAVAVEPATGTVAPATESGDSTESDDSTDSAEENARPGLFDALRAQRAADSAATEADQAVADAETETDTGDATVEDTDAAATSADEPSPAPIADDVTALEDMTALEVQRDAVVADAARQLERRLKRALADEQNELLAGIRAANKQRVALTSIVGDVDSHIGRYVVAIHEVAATTYGAGAALIDAEAVEGHLPAGAVEELLANEVVLPIRERLESLDCLDVEAADLHLDPVRAFYRQRKTDHLGMAANRLANLLCVAGLCDALPSHAGVPWQATTPRTQPA